jgi:hypothetical protein
MSNDNLFIGVDAEGRNRGLSTLFVRNFVGIKNEKIIEVVLENKVQQIYVGSRATPIVNFRKLDDLSKRIKGKDIILTCRLEKREMDRTAFTDNIHYIFSFEEPIDLSVRIVSEGKIKNYDLKGATENDLDDKLYSEDKEL